MSADGQGLLVVLAGPSGVGKGAVGRAVLAELDDARFSISVTTRSARSGERDGVDYHFVDREEFARRVARGDLLEWATFAGNDYGTPAAWAAEQIAAGRVVLLDIEVQGALQIRERVPDALLIFLAPPSFEELERRLRGRGTEDDDHVRRRLAVARQELGYQDRFDTVIVNDDLDRCVSEVVAAIRAARSRR